MDGNDLGSYWSVKYVVIDVPTLFLPPADSYRFHFGRRGIGHRTAKASEYELNRDMIAWIVNVGRQRNIPTEVWSFIEDEDLVSELATKVDRLAGDCIVGWHRWSDHEDAVLELKVDRSIHTVYDADPERALALWGLRGHTVARGKIPTS